MVEQPQKTWKRFVYWLAGGLVFYFLYGFRRSRLNQPAAATRARSAD
jgi:hypothetical protein